MVTVILANSVSQETGSALPGQGILVWGARTTSQDPQWTYVNVRRLMIFIEHSLQRGLQGAVFEMDTPALWAKVQTTIAHFLEQIWKQGFLMGTKPEEAFFVRCDNTIMTQADINAKTVIAQVGVAPQRAAEFLLLKVTVQTKP